MARPYYKPIPGHKYHRKTEESLQIRICNYLRYTLPEVVFRSDFSSGMYLTPGLAAKHARLQSGKGFPDLMILSPSIDGQYSAMFLELKKDGTRIVLKNGSMTADPHIREQNTMMARLRENGYYAHFGVGFDDSVEQINRYFGLPTQTDMF